MEISSKVIFYLFLCVIIIFSQNSVISDTNISVFNDIMNEITNDCYKDLKNIFIFEYLDTQVKPLATYSIMKMERVKYVWNGLTKKAHSFPMTQIDAYFILTDTSSIFNETFNMLNAMNIWNNKRPIFIFAINDDDNLTPLFDFFWNDWSILTFYYIYANSKGRIVVFTSNPYSSYASEYWRHIETRTEKFTFYRRYSKGELCQGFKFDRTKYLNRVRLLFVSMTPLTEGLYIGEDQKYCNGHWHDTLPIFEKALKTQNYLYCGGSNIKRTVYNIQKHKPDLYFSFFRHKRHEPSFPAIFLTMSMVSHNQGYQTLFEQMYNLFGKWIVLYTCCLLAITFIICFYLAKTDKIAFATFEVIRLLINASIRTNINTLGLKIFFLMIFFYFLIVQSMFQGKLAGFLTNPSTIKNADTLDDLESLVYKKILYISDRATLKLNQKVFNKSYETTSIRDVMDIFKNDTSGVFVDNIFNVGEFLKHYSGDVYVAKQPILSMPLSYTLRKENPLNERINKILILHHELGFTDKREKEVSSRLWTSIDRLESISLTKGINKPIDMKSIMPLVIFLASGWVTAVICFIGEIIVYRLQKLKNSLTKQENRKQGTEQKKK